MNPRETNLKIINKAVAKVSDTMALTFGCRIKCEHGDKIITGKSYNGYYVTDWSGQIGSDTMILEKNIIEILGREAQLADVLIAMNEKLGDDVYPVGMHGCTHKPEGQKVLHDWNLKGGIEHQTDEVLQFIAELLK